MMDRRTFLAASGIALEAQEPNQTTWVANVLKRMETIKTGMTRKTLLTVFTTEGGLSNRNQRTYVSQDCPYFKVDVVFDAPGNGIEDPHDIILKISRPYLQFSIID
jgi:hypothetical protein